MVHASEVFRNCVWILAFRNTFTDIFLKDKPMFFNLTLILGATVCHLQNFASHDTLKLYKALRELEFKVQGWELTSTHCTIRKKADSVLSTSCAATASAVAAAASLNKPGEEN